MLKAEPPLPPVASPFTYSIIIPAHNEELLLAPLVETLLASAHPDNLPEIVISENGSRDATRAIAIALCEQYPMVRLVTDDVAGYGRALAHGIRAASSEFVVVINADLWCARFCEQALRLLANGTHLVVGSKRLQPHLDRRHLVRRLITASFNGFLRSAFSYQGTDTHGLKALRRSALVPLIDRCVTDREIFDTELVLRAQYEGLRIDEVPVEVRDGRPPRLSLLRRIVPTLLDLQRLSTSLSPAVNRARRASSDVVVISPYPSAGSPETTPSSSALNWYTRRFAYALQRNGVRPLIVAPKEGPALHWDDAGVPVRSVWRRGMWAPLDIARAVRRARAEVVHLQHELYAYGGIKCALFLPFALRAARGRSRLVTTIHGVIPLESIDADFVRKNGVHFPPSLVRAVWRFHVRSVVGTSHRVHVHSQRLAELLVDQYGAPKEKIVVQELPVQDGTAVAREALRVRRREALGLPPDARVALFFGFISSYKGFDIFVREVAIAMRRDPRLHAVIAGTTPKRLDDAPDAERILASAGIDERRVRRLGFVADEEVAATFFAADVLVLPYTVVMAASGPLSIAAAHGTPVLLSQPFAFSYPDCPTIFDFGTGECAAMLARYFDDDVLSAAARSWIAQYAAQRTWNGFAEVMSEVYRTHARAACLS